LQEAGRRTGVTGARAAVSPFFAEAPKGTLLRAERVG
jgi:hypothetical protein